MSGPESLGAQLVLLCPENHLAGNIFRLSGGIEYEKTEGAGLEPWDTFIDDQGKFIVECDGCDGLKVYEEAVQLLDALGAESGVAIRATYDLKSWPE